MKNALVEFETFWFGLIKITSYKDLCNLYGIFFFIYL